MLSPAARKPGGMTAATPGSFFHARNRNFSGVSGRLSACTGNADDAQSFTFDRFLKARDRVSA